MHPVLLDRSRRRGAIEDATTRRRFLQLIGAAGLLAGCASEDNAGPAREPTAAPSASPAVTSRQVHDVFGSVTLPNDPQRIVALDDQTLGNLLALGIGLERIAGWARGTTPLERYPYLAPYGDLGAINNVGGTFDNPNIEAIVAARPDLILMVAEAGVEFYDPIVAKVRSTGIAFFGAYNGYLRFDDYLRLLSDVAAAASAVDKGAQLAGSLRSRVADLRNRIGQKGPLPSATFLRVPDFNAAELYNTTMPLLDALGLPGDRAAPEEFTRDVTAERLGSVQSDVLFVSDGVDEAQARATLEKNPLWATLPAVRNNRVHFVNEILWGTGYSLPAVEAMLTDIEKVLLS